MTLEEASRTVEGLTASNAKALDGMRLASALPIFAEHLRQTRTGLSMAGVDGAPDWRGFETALWKLSETLRPLMSARRDWRSGSDVLKAVVLLCKDPGYGKGRQNLVLILGQFGGASEATVLASLLDDPDVQGHAIKALARIKDLRYHVEVEKRVAKLKGWMRGAAKRYLALK